MVHLERPQVNPDTPRTMGAECEARSDSDGQGSLRAVRRSPRWVPADICARRDPCDLVVSRWPDGPHTHAVDFVPGQLLGSVSGELGLRSFLEGAGHTFVVTSDKDRADSVFDRELVDADIVISQPFWPAYLTAERIAKARNLKLAITAGIGSDHVDLQAAIDRGISVVEITYSNSISVSEHVVMMILSLVRNYIPSYKWVVHGVGTLPTVSNGPTTSRAWRLGRWPLDASALPS